MSWFYRRIVRPVLFSQEAEVAHERTLRGLRWLSHYPMACKLVANVFAASSLPVNVFGLKFPNPIGLAAGMDKCADAVPAWQALGFGFTELGGVTWHPQPGNPRPRIFRAVREKAIVNRMGFNNPGAEALAERLAQCRAGGLWPGHPVGINLGKSKTTPLEKAAEDYANSFRVLQPHADFFVVNVSSPNTPNLRQLQDKAALKEILVAMQEAAERSNFKLQTPGKLQISNFNGQGLQQTRPILVKVAPDLSFDALDEVLELAFERQLAGIVATNTTIARPQANNQNAQRVYAETGGLSGRPLRDRSTELVRHIFRQTKGRLPIIGVGGIFTAEDAWEKLAAGASLVQVYTGLVYEGPGISKAISQGLKDRLAQRGFNDIGQVTGIEA